MKKLMNTAESVVKDSLQGMEHAHGDLIKVHYDPDFITRAGSPVQGKAAIISGGGSGHEPMHGGLVGKGMLDGACPGDVFTSPTPDQMEACTKAVDGGAGVLHIVKNYTGDVMNFDMAKEICVDAGIKVNSVVIDDDVAVKDSLYTTGRRGVGTTVIAEKICGAAAEAGKNLQELTELCKAVNANGRSIGMALSSCAVPAAGKPTFELGDSEIEFGIGIHGEPGRTRMTHIAAKELVAQMTDAILGDLSFSSGDSTIVMVNGMGGSPLIELYIVYNELAKIFGARNISIKGKLIGNYITSLEMQGCSITVVKATEDMLSFWNAPVHTPAIRWGI